MNRNEKKKKLRQFGAHEKLHAWKNRIALFPLLMPSVNSAYLSFSSVIQMKCAGPPNILHTPTLLAYFTSPLFIPFHLTPPYSNRRVFTSLFTSPHLTSPIPYFFLFGHVTILLLTITMLPIFVATTVRTIDK